MEYLDIVDENNNLTGNVVERKEVHEKRLFHRHISCWIMNNKGEILLQRRSYTNKKNPGKWAKSGGHVNSGETVLQALKRELNEELGIVVNDNQIIELEIFKSEKEHYFSYNFLILVDDKIEYKLQKEEVEEVKYFRIEELENCKNDDNFVFYKWTLEDYKKQLDILKEKRKTLIKENI